MISSRVPLASLLLLRLACGVDGDEAPQQHPLTGVVEVAAGGDHACARLADGRVACWGYNEYGQAGQPYLTRGSNDSGQLGASGPVLVLA